MVERRALLSVTRGQIDGEGGHIGEAAAGLLLMALGDVGLRELAWLRGLAAEGELELTAAAGALGVIVEGPLVAGAAANGRGTKLAGEERRDERAAALVLARDEPHGQASAAALAVQVHTQRTDGPSARTGLLGPEKAEEDAAAGVGLRQGEGPRRAELVVERHGADFIGVIRRLRRPHDAAAHLALLLAGEVRLAVAEILHDRRHALRNDAVVVALPAGILIEGFGLENGLRLFLGPAVYRAGGAASSSAKHTAAVVPGRIALATVWMEFIMVSFCFAADLDRSSRLRFGGGKEATPASRRHFSWPNAGSSVRSQWPTRTGGATVPLVPRRRPVGWWPFRVPSG